MPLVLGGIVLWLGWAAVAWGAAGLSADSPLLWSHGLIPYSLKDKAFNESQQKIIEEAVDYWNAVTPVSLYPRTTEGDYIELSLEGSERKLPEVGGTSGVGRVGKAQPLKLSVGFDGRSVFHEFGHAFGFIHEHQRWDRHDVISTDPKAYKDGYEELVNDWIVRTYPIGNDKNQYSLYTPYDPQSVMHYPPNAFAKEGGATISWVAQREGKGEMGGPLPSAGDIYGVRMMYAKQLSHWTDYPHFVCGRLERPGKDQSGFSLIARGSHGGVFSRQSYRLRGLDPTIFQTLAGSRAGDIWCAWGPKVYQKKIGEGEYFLWAVGVQEWEGAWAVKGSAFVNPSAKNYVGPDVVELSAGAWDLEGSRCGYRLERQPAAGGQGDYEVRLVSSWGKDQEKACGDEFETRFECSLYPAGRFTVPSTYCLWKHRGSGPLDFLQVKSATQFLMRWKGKDFTYKFHPAAKAAARQE